MYIYCRDMCVKQNNISQASISFNIKSYQIGFHNIMQISFWILSHNRFVCIRRILVRFPGICKTSRQSFMIHRETCSSQYYMTLFFSSFCFKVFPPSLQNFGNFYQDLRIYSLWSNTSMFIWIVTIFKTNNLRSCPVFKKGRNNSSSFLLLKRRRTVTDVLVIRHVIW